MQQQKQIRRCAFRSQSLFLYGQHQAGRDVGLAVGRRVGRGQQEQATRRLSASLSRATALLFRRYAVGLRALGLKNSAYLLHNSPVGRDLAPLRALAGKASRYTAQEPAMLRSAASARLKTPGALQAARSAPNRRPSHSLRSFESRSAVGRASRSKDRLLRAWGRLVTFRSLGAAHPSAVTDSLRAGALRSSFGPWGPHHSSPALGGLRGCPARAGAILAKRKSCALSACARQEYCASFQEKLPVICECSPTTTAAFMSHAATISDVGSQSHLRRKIIYAIASR